MGNAGQQTSFSRRHCELALTAMVEAERHGHTTQTLADAAVLGLAAAPQWGEVVPSLEAKVNEARAELAKAERILRTVQAAAQFDDVGQPDAEAAGARAEALAALGGRPYGLGFHLRHSWAPAIQHAAALLEFARAEEPPADALRARVEAIADRAGVSPRRALQLAVEAAQHALRRPVGRPYLDSVGMFVVGAVRMGEDDVAVRVEDAQLRGFNPAAPSLASVGGWSPDVSSWARADDVVVLRGEDLAAL